jgi:hypothetical protein
MFLKGVGVRFIATSCQHLRKNSGIAAFWRQRAKHVTGVGVSGGREGRRLLVSSGGAAPPPFIYLDVQASGGAKSASVLERRSRYLKTEVVVVVVFCRFCCGHIVGQQSFASSPHPELGSD